MARLGAARLTGATGLLGLALLLGSGTAAPAAPAAEEAPLTPADTEAPLSYTVKRGDTLYMLAKVSLLHLGDYRIVQKLNRVRDPYRLPIGSILRVPRPLLRTVPLQATVVAFRGAAAVDGQDVRLGGTIGEGGRIRTGTNAFLSLGLADGSTVTLPSQSMIRVERLRRIALTGEMERFFRLESGRSQTGVTPRANGRDRFEIRTPVSVAAVRGTDFRVAVIDDGKAATTEVLGGHVGLAGGGGETILDPGLGARVSPDGTSGPVTLLPAPALADPGRPQTESEIVFRIEPLDGAARFRVQIAKDAGFLDIAEEVLASGADARLPSLANGDYFVRVTGIDRQEIEGFPRVYGFERHLNALRATAERLPGGRRFLFRWQDLGGGTRVYRFQLAPVATPATPMVDEPALTERSFVATDLPPGDYVWRILSTDTDGGTVHATWSAPQTLTVAGPDKAVSKPKRAQPAAP